MKYLLRFVQILEIRLEGNDRGFLTRADYCLPKLFYRWNNAHEDNEKAGDLLTTAIT